MRKHKFIISGGGTGGHIFPAISIADELKFRFSQSDILFVGARDRMEMIKVPAHGYKIKGLWISGFKRKLSLGNLLFPFKVVYSLFHSLIIISKFKPEVVIGTGGFASGPTLIMAQRKGIPTLIQEQNSFPGITNKLLGKKLRYQHKSWISYVITINGPEPVEYLTSQIDYEHYVDKQIKPIAEGILPFIGLSFEDITSQQMGLF